MSGRLRYTDSLAAHASEGDPTKFGTWPNGGMPAGTWDISMPEDEEFIL
jgi:hypothetical protein